MNNRRSERVRESIFAKVEMALQGCNLGGWNITLEGREKASHASLNHPNKDNDPFLKTEIRGQESRQYSSGQSCWQASLNIADQSNSAILDFSPGELFLRKF